jgi:hypothetical protein
VKFDSTPEGVKGLTPTQLRNLADTIERRDVAECEGWTAAWCPIHGDCTCAPEPPEDGSEHRAFEADYDVGDDVFCPLHGRDSAHAPDDALANPSAHIMQHVIIPTGADVDDPSMRHFGIIVQRERGHDWTVRNAGMVYNKVRAEFDHISSAESPDDVKAWFYFTEYEAISQAKRLSDNLIVNDMTYAQWAARRDGLA